jgi:hypothetical protein
MTLLHDADLLWVVWVEGLVQAKGVYLLTGGADDYDRLPDPDHAGVGESADKKLVSKITARISRLDALVQDRDAPHADATRVIRAKQSIRQEFQGLQKDVQGIPTVTPQLKEDVLRGLHDEYVHVDLGRAL